jgi:serine/threonine protein kinase
MSLAPGVKLGPYEIIGLLGAGGMGEVYRVRDTRLGRLVALKTLPGVFVDDRDRRNRFEREARILGALNHPNVLAVFDVGSEQGTAFFVSELLDGRTLRALIVHGALPVPRALGYASQIAHGLTAAHGKGVFHRDLKPENIFITSDDRVKILDFGLAKQVDLDVVTSDAETVSDTRTTTGAVMGSPGYMAPEQVRGQKADHRADIFSFGAIFYEMISGRRAFRGETSVETMNAILNQDPPGLDNMRPDLSASLQSIIWRCMEKKQERRFQCASDLAFAIEVLSKAPTWTPAIQPRGSRSRLRQAALPIVLGIALASLIWLMIPSNATPKFRQLIFGRGYISSARFTPDGQSVVFGAAFYGRPRQIFWTRLDGRSSRSMGLPPADILGIANDGKMAISLGRHNFLQWMAVGTLGEAPISGGAPREILEDICDADITADGKDYAVVRCGRNVQDLEFPIGHVLFRTNGWISHPRISPDGKEVAFLEHPILGDDRGFVSLVDTSGAHKRLTGDWLSEFGVAWSPSGKEIWFSAATQESPQALRAVTRSGKQRVVLSSVSDVLLHDVGRKGTVLLTTVRVSTEIQVGHRSGSPDRLLELPDEHASLVGLSSNGKRVALGASGTGSGENYSTLTMTVGATEATRIGEGDPTSISPDGKWVLSLIPSQPSKLILYPTGTGEARPIDVSPVHILNNLSSWTSDGSRILVTGAEGNGPPRAYLVDATSGVARPVTPPGSSDAIISPNGQRVVARNSDSNRFFIYSSSGPESRPVEGLAADEVPIQWDISNHKLYVWNRKLPAEVFLLDLFTGRRELSLQIAPVEVSGLLYGEILITPDGKSYGYRYRRVIADLFLAENLH